MHMADALVSPEVGLTMTLVSGGLLAYSIYESKKSFDASKIPLMGVMGAFVFAAQMINFAIPATGSSGHIGGAVLLSALLGSYRAFLVMFCVLLIQAFLFADGGLLALGCNLFNMGFWGCFIAYPLVYRPILSSGKFTNFKIMAASILACILTLQLGAFSVVLETLASDITELPFKVFLLLMHFIHLSIGFVEGLATGALLIFLRSAKPQLLSRNSNDKGVSYKTLLCMLTLASFLIGGGLSLLASSSPDGLEWSVEKTSPNAEISQSTPLHSSSQDISQNTSIFADYTIGGKDEVWRQSLAGVCGTLLTLASISLLSYFLSRRAKYN